MPAFLWTLVRVSEAPELARDEGWLSPRERELLAALRFERRRRKWLLGRLAGKRVVAQALALAGEPVPAPADLTIDNDGAGAPFAAFADGRRVPLCVSISHREGVALAAAATLPGVSLGADLEVVSPRDPALVRQFFTDLEQSLVASAPEGPERDRRVARIWSAKESVTKALGLGLRVDVRAIEVAGDDGPAWADAPPGFSPLAVRQSVTDAAVLAVARDEGDLVVTVVRLASC